MKPLSLIFYLLIAASIFSAIDIPVKDFVSNLYHRSDSALAGHAISYTSASSSAQHDLQLCQTSLITLLHTSEDTPTPGCGPDDSISKCRELLLSSACMGSSGSPKTNDTTPDYSSTAHLELHTAVNQLQATLNQVFSNASGSHDLLRLSAAQKAMTPWCIKQCAINMQTGQNGGLCPPCCIPGAMC
jgi:hypothetical protein